MTREKLLIIQPNKACMFKDVCIYSESKCGPCKGIDPTRKNNF
jgi:hypothetical protein